MAGVRITKFDYRDRDTVEEKRMYWEQFSRACSRLSAQELADVLKWPFCVGEAEQIVLAELERKLSEEFKRAIKFDGDLGKFIEQAESLGIKDLAAPAKRPLFEDARKELAATRQAAEVKRAVLISRND